MTLATRRLTQAELRHQAGVVHVVDVLDHQAVRAEAREGGAPDTHWGRTLFPLDRAIEVAAGESFGVELHCDPSSQGSCEFYWSVKMANRPLEEHDTRRARRDRAIAGRARPG